MPANIFDWNPLRPGLTAATWESVFTQTGLDRDRRYYFRGTISSDTRKIKNTSVLAASFVLDVWPKHVFPYVVDHVYYNNYMCTSEQLPTDAVRCFVLPNGAQVASAPGAPDGSGYAEQDTDTASDNSDVGDNVGQNMDIDDDDDYPLVRLNPASKAEIYASFLRILPHRVVS